MLTTIPGRLIRESHIPGISVSRSYRLDEAAVLAASDAEIDAVRTVVADHLSVSTIFGGSIPGHRLNVRVVSRDGEIVGHMTGHGDIFETALDAKRYCLAQGYTHAYEWTSLRAVRS